MKGGKSIYILYVFTPSEKKSLNQFLLKQFSILCSLSPKFLALATTNVRVLIDVQRFSASLICHLIIGKCHGLELLYVQ